MRSTIAFLTLVSVLAVSACGGASEPAAGSQPAPASTPDSAPLTTTAPSGVAVAQLIDRTWRLVGHQTIGGVLTLEFADATLRFAQDSDGASTGTVAVDTGCNSGSAAVKYGPDVALTIEPIVLTKMACSDELNDAESIIVNTLGFELQWSVTDDLLRLSPTTVSDTGLELSDGSSDTEPSTSETPTGETGFGQSEADRETLLATNWLAQRFITVGPLDEVPAGSTAGFHFTDDTTISVDTGCNTGTATVTFGPGGKLTVDDLVTTEIACEDPVEAKLLALLGLRLVWSVNGDELTIYPLEVSDSGLILVDAEAVAVSDTSA